MVFLQVALDVPLFNLFTYRAVDADASDVGRRVIVPFGKKVLVGVIMEVAHEAELPAKELRTALHILRDAPALPRDILRLLKFCSDYYHHPLGEVVFSALPTRLRRRRPLLASDLDVRYRLTAAGCAVEPATRKRGARLEVALLDRLRAEPEGVTVEAVRSVGPNARAALQRMIRRGWVETVAQPESAPEPARTGSEAMAPTLTAAQEDAVENVAKTFGSFAPTLLFGVTGSGKTEVYLRLIAHAAQRGHQALLLVPEINLTPQLVDHLSARFPAVQVVALHSGLSESERLRNWLAAQSGSARIVLGTRLGVFTPLPDLGLIILDEENDASYKQADGFRYSARDVALVRAKFAGVPIVLGSATPSLETFHNAQRGGYRFAVLPERASGTLPSIECVDTRGAMLIDGMSQPLLGAVREALKSRDQCLVYINRRGYAPVTVCRDCSWSAECHRCTAKLVLHASDGLLHCHHCGHHERPPVACPGCGNKDLLPVGQGTQRVEAALARLFPKARVLRVDSDNTRRKDAWQTMRKRIDSRDVDILVGTQMLAKGHDFPHLNLVGVLNADTSLFSTNYRATEQLFARLMQVAGRAGRGSRAGRVMVQTEFPQHPLYAALLLHDYSTFAVSLLAERKRAGLPPFSYHAILRAEAPRLESALTFLRAAARAAQHYSSGVTVYDPVPAQLTRLAGLERAHVLVEACVRSQLHACLANWCGELAAIARRAVRWRLDVDPIEL